MHAHDGHLVKTMGDAYMVAFKSAADGLRCAIAIQQALAALRTGNSELAEVVGAGGLHTGEMVREGDDFFGRRVNLAPRVAGHASGGETFVSGVVRDLVTARAAGKKRGPGVPGPLIRVLDCRRSAPLAYHSCKE